MILCGKRYITLVQTVIIYSTISCTTKFGVLQRENKIMSVVVFLVLYAIAININNCAYMIFFHGNDQLHFSCRINLHLKKYDNIITHK